ncbi:nuclear receptor subfamily 1, group H, member 2, isoform CRA_b, partial [Rattus norvegicus]
MVLPSPVPPPLHPLLRRRDRRLIHLQALKGPALPTSWVRQGDRNRGVGRCEGRVGRRWPLSFGSLFLPLPPDTSDSFLGACRPADLSLGVAALSSHPRFGTSHGLFPGCCFSLSLSLMASA